MFKEYIKYLKDNPKGLWFKARLYGWGWVPVRWQGWIVVVVYLAAVVLFSLTIDDNSPAREIWFTFIIPIVLLTIALIRIAYKTGEKPRWNWGPPDKYKP